MTPEGKVKKQVKAILDKHKPYVWYFMPVSRGMGRSGIPDIIACIQGQFVGIEVKAATGRLKGVQKLELTAIESAGGIAMVVDPSNIEQFKLFVELAAAHPLSQDIN